MSLERVHEWPERLDEFFQRRADEEFAWGKNDCALSICDAVLAMTAVDLAASLRGKYQSAFGAAKTIRAYLENDAATLEDLALRFALDFEAIAIPPMFAQRGDVLLFDDPKYGPTLGMVALDGRYAWIFSDAGMVRASIRAARRAWRI